MLVIETLSQGDLIAFQIVPQEGYTSQNVGRWGVAKVLFRTSRGSLAFSLLEGLYHTCPKPLQVRFKKVISPKRYQDSDSYFAQGNEPMIFLVPVEFPETLNEATVIGKEIWPRLAEFRELPRIKKLGHARTICRFDHASVTLDGEQRYVHDRAAFQADTAAAICRWQEKRQADDLRQKTRLKGLTLRTLLGETPFHDWEQSQLVPPDITKTVRRRAKALLKSLSTLGDKPRRPAARKELRDFVHWLNALDGTQGFVIETVEREDICAFLEEICWAIRQKPLIHEIDEWREW